MSYQFLHIDSYSREGSNQIKTVKSKNNGEKTTIKKRSVRQILEEQARKKEACPHIADPKNPTLIYGIPPMEILPIVEKWAENTTDAKGRKLRKDGLCALVGVASLPQEMEADFSRFAKDTAEWLKKRYGERLKSIVFHDDEAHPHLHFTVVPLIGEKFDDIHDGYKASKQAKQEGKKKGEQNLAYIKAMRSLQDEFSEKVAMSHGLTRLGPGRRRLTRAQWNTEKKQAKFLADTKAIANIAVKKGYKEGIHKAENKAQAIIVKAQEQSRGMGAMLGEALAGFAGAWHRPTSEALAEVEKIKEEAKKRKKKAEARAEEAEKEANRRVTTAGNLLSEQINKNRELEEDLKREQEKSRELEKVANWYQSQLEKSKPISNIYKTHNKHSSI